MEIAVKSHVGHIRHVNEDSADVFVSEKQGVLAVVADGMGGHQAGDVASQLTLKKLKEAFDEVDIEKDATEWAAWLLAAIEDANQYIYQYALEHPACLGMGTTIAVVLLLPNFYIVAHVGDSRIYRFTNETIDSLTEDHSLVNELLKSGQITWEEAEYHPQRNVITRALGTEEAVSVDLKTLSFLEDEQILLCSDGLSNMVSEEQLTQVLSSSDSLEEKADELLRLALAAGGDDNISLVLLHMCNDDVEGK